MSDIKSKPKAKQKTKVQPEYITAICIRAGIITLIEPDGSIADYRQRGMNTMNKMYVNKLIFAGLLDPRWKQYKELPKNYRIYFEDEEIMGKARATYPYSYRKPEEFK